MTSLPAEGSGLKLPPSPRRASLRELLQELQRDTPAFLRSVAAECGPIAFIDLGHSTAYLLTGPEYIEQVLAGAPGKFRKNEDNRRVASIMGDGLLTSEGTRWRSHRRVLAPRFLPSQVARHAALISALASEHASSVGAGGVRDVNEDMKSLALQALGRALFGARPIPRLSEIVSLIDRAILALHELWHSLDRFSPKSRSVASRETLQTTMAEMDRILAELIETAGRESEDATVLTTMLQACGEAGTGFTSRDVRDEALTLLVAGHETTALTLTYALYELARRPDLAVRLRKELDASTGSSDVPLLEAVIQETLRLHSPVWSLGREALEDVEIGGYVIPKGAQAWMPQCVVHRDARWYPEPDAFRPERWLDGLEERLPRFAYFPFGGGPRVCVGLHFGMMELRIVLAELCRRLEYSPVPETRLIKVAVMTLRPAEPVRLHVRPLGGR